MQLSVLLLVATSTLSQAYELKMAKSRKGPWKNVEVKITGKTRFTLRTLNATEVKTYTFTKDTETEVKDGMFGNEINGDDYVSIKQLKTEFRYGWVPSCIAKKLRKKANLYFKALDEMGKSEADYETFKTQILNLRCPNENDTVIKQDKLASPRREPKQAKRKQKREQAKESKKSSKFFLKKGARVVLKGLKQTGYNGKIGTVVERSYKNHIKGDRRSENRWMVQLDEHYVGQRNDGSVINLNQPIYVKKQNLAPLSLTTAKASSQRGAEMDTRASRSPSYSRSHSLKLRRSATQESDVDEKRDFETRNPQYAPSPRTGKYYDGRFGRYFDEEKTRE